jgi:hypothetical protein
MNGLDFEQKYWFISFIHSEPWRLSERYPGISFLRPHDLRSHECQSNRKRGVLQINERLSENRTILIGLAPDNFSKAQVKEV